MLLCDCWTLLTWLWASQQFDTLNGVPFAQSIVSTSNLWKKKSKKKKLLWHSLFGHWYAWKCFLTKRRPTRSFFMDTQIVWEAIVCNYRRLISSSVQFFFLGEISSEDVDGFVSGAARKTILLVLLKIIKTFIKWVQNISCHGFGYGKCFGKKSSGIERRDQLSDSHPHLCRERFCRYAAENLSAICWVLRFLEMLKGFSMTFPGNWIINRLSESSRWSFKDVL